MAKETTAHPPPQDIGATTESPSVPSIGSVVAGWGAHWKDVFTARNLAGDIMAGITVAAVALPLNLALALASGVPASAGIIAGIIGGFLAGFFGGSSLQVSGPAAALSSLVLGIAAAFGHVGVMAACLIVGVVLVAMALTRAGRFARFVPESVLAGFTTGVGLKLLDQQIPVVLGFDLRVFDIAQMMHQPLWLREVSWLAVVCGLFVALLVVSTRQFKRFPAAIAAIAAVTFVSVYLKWNLPRVGEIPTALPTPSLPLLPDEQWLDLAAMALPLAILVGVESLLSAKVVDHMAPVRKHEPNAELFGQGLANIAMGFFGGMPVSGVVVRSGVNAQSGGKTRLGTLTHSVALGAAVLLAAQHISRIPLPALAGLLCVVGIRLIEVSEFQHLLRHRKVEALAFAAATAGTVSGHLMLGLAAGVAISLTNAWVRRITSKAPATVSRITTPRTQQQVERGLRAVLPGARGGARRSGAEDLPQHHGWLTNISSEPVVPATAFIHEQATVIGRVVMGDHVHVAAGSSVRADEGAPFFLGPNTNVQDGVVIHALQQKWVRVGNEDWAVYVGRNVSMAHDALVHGPCYVGDDTFIGFKAVVHDSIVGSHCFIGIGAIVVGVEIPDGRFVPHGMIVSTQDAADALPLAGEAQHHFNEDVVDVNRGLAVAYQTAEQRLRSHLADARLELDAPKTRPWEPAWNRQAPSQLHERF